MTFLEALSKTDFRHTVIDSVFPSHLSVELIEIDYTVIHVITSAFRVS